MVLARLSRPGLFRSQQFQAAIKTSACAYSASSASSPSLERPPALRIMIMGPPGGGKGTISSRIVRDFGVTHLSSGDALRNQILSKTSLGLEADKHMKAGNLVPDDLMINLMLNELARNEGKSWLLDGFPRTVKQAERLNETFPLDIAINLDVPFDEIVERIKHRKVHLPSGRVYHDLFNPPKVTGIDDVTGEALVVRDDDKPESVMRRLQRYADSTQPLVDYYKSKRILYSFAGRESDVIYPQVQRFFTTYLEMHTKGKRDTSI
eukprot:Opistho-2@54711